MIWAHWMEMKVILFSKKQIIGNEIQKENEKEKEDERNTQIYLKQQEVVLDIGNYNTLVLPGNTTLNTT